jgi:hypothetical protein
MFLALVPCKTVWVGLFLVLQLYWLHVCVGSFVEAGALWAGTATCMLPHQFHVAGCCGNVLQRIQTSKLLSRQGVGQSSLLVVSVVSEQQR